MTAVSKAEFARIIGRDRSWVTRMAQNGRLSMAGDQVNVEASRALIEQTKGTRDDVAGRHADARLGGQEPAQSGVSDDAMVRARKVKAVSEARRVAAAADREEMERDKLAGDLIAREDVDAAMKFLGATVRGLLDVFPDQTAPIVAPTTSLEEVHAQLSEACRNVLVGLGDAIERQRAALGRVA